MLSKLILLLPTPLCVLDGSRRLLAINSAALRLLGFEVRSNTAGTAAVPDVDDLAESNALSQISSLLQWDIPLAAETLEAETLAGSSAGIPHQNVHQQNVHQQNVHQQMPQMPMVAPAFRPLIYVRLARFEAIFIIQKE